MENLERVLRRHAFLEGLRPEDTAFVVGCARNVVLQAGQFIFREGDPADALFLVRQGQIALEIDVPPRGTLVVETLEAGDILGWTWLLGPMPWHTHARAVTQVRLVHLDGGCLRDKLDQDNVLGFTIAKRLLAAAHQRLERVRLQRLDVYAKAER